MGEQLYTTKLWQGTLAVQPERDPVSDARQRLRSAFLALRDRAAYIAAEIARDLPEFTVHDITHLDALWDLADLITGDDFPINPAEAFVIGGAFLVHDLGLGLAAIPNGRGALREDPLWSDLLSLRFKKRLGRLPSEEELLQPPKEDELEIITEVLRIRHAQRAIDIIVSPIGSSAGIPMYLIEDSELRLVYGEVIGSIAHSHWLSIDQIRKEFGEAPELGAPGMEGFPPSWTLDRLKLACLLRTSDAAHLDSRRAPGFLRALRKPSGYADVHWRFQASINKVHRFGERLVFTSSRSFGVEDADAWWLGYDLIRLCDRELHQVDSLFQDMGVRYRLAARSVAGAEEPSRLKRYIPTRGWEPVDARVQVSDVATLVRRLGGEQLYGDDDKHAPLREVIQNASDAIRARRFLEKRGGDWGNITVRTGEDQEGFFMEVSDNGIGMSLNVLTGPFLDFGTSFWQSQLALEELPGLEATSFRSTGRYGIGFFSIFMLSDHVRVVTRRYDLARVDTLVLEFPKGISHRPLLRKARQEEQSFDGGTSVRFWPRNQPKDAFFRELGGSLQELCAWLCPALDVNLWTEDGAGKPQRVISAGDWITIEGMALLERMSQSVGRVRFRPPAERLAHWAPNLRILCNRSGEIVGRAAIVHDEDEERRRTVLRSGVITIGGFRAESLPSHMTGIIFGSPKNAARNRANAVVEEEEFARWATEQAILFASTCKNLHSQRECARYIRLFGGNTGPLPLALTKRGWISAEQIRTISWPAELLLLEADPENFADVDLRENVLIVDGVTTMTWPIDLSEISRQSCRSPEEDEELGWWHFNDWRVSGAVVEAVASSWLTSVEEVQEISDMPVEDIRRLKKRIVGTRGGRPVKESLRVIKKPSVSLP